MEKSNLKQSKNRLKYTLLIFITLFMLLLSRLFYIMIIKSKEYKSYAKNQWTSEIKIIPKRGRILYSNAKELFTDIFNYLNLKS